MKTLEQRVYGCPQMGGEKSLRNSETSGYRSKKDGTCPGSCSYKGCEAFGEPGASYSGDIEV